MYIGIDLGTSGVKVILLNEQGEVVAAQTEKLTVSRPHPLWSEQDPEQWWQATDRAMKALGDQHSLQDVKALGIAGQGSGLRDIRGDFVKNTLPFLREFWDPIFEQEKAVLRGAF
ncbi:FGGY family carbohydrate kinase [Zymomonas mobilis]|uniref:FGGY family carbohydrate kinase n=1 Tax=Zymomonas mobilis TaxID=542 RepID=UPI003B97BA33